MTPAPQVSILIVNWNTKDLVLQCLDALPRAADGIRYEAIVVDNGSVDGSAAALADRTDIVLMQNDENRGFAAAVNQAYRASSGEFILLLNSDVELTHDALAALVRFLEARPSVAGSAPLYLNPDGSPQPFHFRLPTFRTMLMNGSSVFRRLIPGSDRSLREYRMLDVDFSEPREVEQPSASCLLLRRSALDPDSVFDERYPIFFNDVQFARWLKARGGSMWVTPEARVLHEAHSSGRKLGSSAGRRVYIGSLIRMLEETEPPYKVWLYRAVVLVQNLYLAAARAPHALVGRDLLAALSGDPGSLPRQPSR
ncbi:MAG TPA: glycosyltransferase family 2 protein [Gaiellaceae bacterium]|nr:glycosyltransferase family 2 protein [Gaiellaceae bacterium]